MREKIEKLLELHERMDLLPFHEMIVMDKAKFEGTTSHDIRDHFMESMEHMRSPVVKMLAKNFGTRKPEDRHYTVYLEWEDGETEKSDEDVGGCILGYGNCFEL
ncbi:hypothetical protein A7D00_0314 [Trichophyton violaceum]|uniref:Uncharacterized protein n=1 Tax=Trichophyton violaceum TaxID=34388 RepID=A0A178FQE2_TRIVO|nr:hypothetical protein A7D00_0314 [Trichophyton violaceum]